MSELRQAAQAALDALESDAIQRTFAGGVRMSNAAIALRAALAQPPAQPDRLYDALCWALGVGDDWKPRPDGAGPFYWRKELAERAGICWDGSRYVMAAQPPAPTAQPAADDRLRMSLRADLAIDAAMRDAL